MDESNQFMIDFNEDSLFHEDPRNRLPICYLLHGNLGNMDVNLRLQALEYLLKQVINIRPLCPTIGGLFHEVNEGEFVVSKKLVEKFGADPA